MNLFKIFPALLFVLFTQIVKSQITLNPVNESQGNANLVMKQVEITKNQTVISFVHTSPFATSPDNISWVEIEPKIQIIAVGGKRIFKFIKAEGIPVAPDRHVYKSKDEKLFFKVYFEKLDPGIEKFDLFECTSGDRIVCFNFYGVKINNPEIIKKQVAIKPKVTLTGKLLDANTKKPISGKIIFEILPSQKIIGTIQTQITGEYTFTFNPSKSVYSYLASAKGFLAGQDNIDLQTFEPNQVINKNIFLKPISTGESIVLHNIFFAQGEYELLSSSFSELDKLVKILQDNPTMEIELEGHTDIIGNPADNLKLSEDRVKAVKAYLIKKGINEKRVQIKAYGGTRPLKTDGTDEERRVNRRVEFKILKQ